MLQLFLSDVKFFELLLAFDKDLAENARKRKCLFCEETLHQANYERKLRGGPEIPDGDFNLRFSFCCYFCRRRMTPPSFRFFGRRVYLGAIMILISAMLWGSSPRRLQRLRELCGADKKTLERWRKWWAEKFIKTDFWKALSPRFAFIWDAVVPVPRQLLRILGGKSLQEKLRGVLNLLLPLTSREGKFFRDVISVEGD